MSADEILQELPKLTPEERLKIYWWIAAMEQPEEIVPGSEFREAIEEGLRSMETEPLVPLAEVRQKISQWARPSS